MLSFEMASKMVQKEGRDVVESWRFFVEKSSISAEAAIVGSVY